MRRLLQREVGQPVVDKIDASSRVAQGSILEGELLGRKDRGLYAEAAKEPLEENELGIQKLLLGGVVHDCDAGRNAAAPGDAPLLHEHLEDRALDALHRDGAAHQSCHVLAAGALCPGEQAVQQSAAGIGVDLDQLRTCMAPRWKS